MNIEEYDDFIEDKVGEVKLSGFDVLARELHHTTFPHQTDTIKWALKIGKALIAKSFGLGKTHDQIEIARMIHEHTGKPFLIICPLGVKHQFQYEDAERLGVEIHYVRSDHEIEHALKYDRWCLITNYERVRDGNISQVSVDKFAGVSLDEGANLRSLDSKTWDTFSELFKNTAYRFVCTATPSPNNYIELLNYAVFLGKIDRGFALTRWFQRDSQKAGNLTLYPHHEENFWLWVSTWALFIYKPSDLGHDDTGYELPELHVHWHRLPVDHRRAWRQKDSWGQYRLILNAAGGLKEAAAEKRATMEARIEKTKEIIARKPDDYWILWHHLEDERRMIVKEIPGSIAVYGSQKLEIREQSILDFTHGKIKILATKPRIAGSGCNFQKYCHNVIYVGLDYKFHDFIQSLHRVWRFMQNHEVHIHVVYAESEDDVVNIMKRKWQQHNVLVSKMQSIVKKYGLHHDLLGSAMKRNIGVIRNEVNGMERFTAVNNDCVLEMPNIDTESIDMIFTSIPFGNHYEYTDQEEDFGHNQDDDKFFAQMDFLVPELLRVLKPGRICGIHVKDRILYGHQTNHGFMEVNPFSDKTVANFRKNGFMYEGRRTLVKDVVAENNQTYRLGWTEMAEGDATKMGSGLPEYILLFRKPPSDNNNQRADEPVLKSKIEYTRARWQIDANQFWCSNGNVLVDQDAFSIYDHEAHVARLEKLESTGNLPSRYFVEPPQSNNEYVWTDVNYMHGLNANQARRKVEQHICPLPIDIVRRFIRLYSNEGDLILDPFAGLFTVPYVAIQMKRMAYGIELSPTSFADGVKYCKEAEHGVLAPTLFDLAGIEA